MSYTLVYRIGFFSFLVLISIINIVFGLILTSKAIGRPEPMPVPATITKGGSVNVANGSAIDFWEYKSQNLNCLISIHSYVTTQGSFTQISCSK